MERRSQPTNDEKPDGQKVKVYESRYTPFVSGLEEIEGQEDRPGSEEDSESEEVSMACDPEEYIPLGPTTSAFTTHHGRPTLVMPRRLANRRRRNNRSSAGDREEKGKKKERRGRTRTGRKQRRRKA